MSALLPKADIRTVDLVVWHALQRKAFIRSRGAPLGDTRRLRPSARHYLVKRLAVDFENFDRSTGRSVVKDADCKPAGVPRKRIKVGAVLFEDRPMYMLMMSMHDVASAVAAVVTVWIDFPYHVVGVLLIQRTVWIKTGMYEYAVLIEMHQR
jgi:hypothetical protein